MIRALGRIPLSAALDTAGLLLVVVAVAVLAGAYAFVAAGVACLLLSWRYGE